MENVDNKLFSLDTVLEEDEFENVRCTCIGSNGD